ncbi:NADPH-dependent F420 reductase [Microbacterium oleivorans]|uniref:Putative dinucleotide-binding enzyme n=1 Tax=Microbacterium oleivorans TaxID=273677 RepID=A0A031FTG3_9MICO|nr:NAD(P)-binding domain-containing protein [Microbacterium oleivorans]EZP27883.1 putative dinucleotide-binding enzyme [Microbacterium oleivorans]
MTHVGIIGAGHIGSAVARGLVAQGHQVAISNSRGPETLADLVAELGENAHAMTAADAAAFGEWVVVTIPLKNIDDLPVVELAGKIVVDTNNYYWERDGHIAELDEKKTTTSRMLQDRLPESTVVKGFNHIPAADITTDGAPAGAADRRALATSSDSDDAIVFITKLYDDFGFDTVNVGPLDESWRVERDQPAYVIRQTADELRANLARAGR